jgi:transposase
MFEDEFGFSFTWAPRSQTKGVGKYRREVSTISGKIYKRHFGRAVRADDLIVGLSPSPATSLHPGLGSVAGPSGETSARLPGNSVIVEWLPPYAPDLNPEEYCQNSV